MESYIRLFESITNQKHLTVTGIPISEKQQAVAELKLMGSPRARSSPTSTGSTKL